MDNEQRDYREATVDETRTDGKYADCKGGLHDSHEERHDSDVQIVSNLLDQIGKLAEEYCTGNTDYPYGYFHIVRETSHEHSRLVERWIRDSCGDLYGHTVIDETMAKIVDSICEELDVDYHCEPIYNHSDYSGYSGKGCCLFSFKIEEHEEQIVVNDFPELKSLHEQGRLDDVLDDVNCDVYVSRSRKRVKNEETEHYEYVGRETYNPYPRNQFGPTFEIYTNPGGGWDFVIEAEEMETLLCNAILECNGFEDDME